MFASPSSLSIFFSIKPTPAYSNPEPSSSPTADYSPTGNQDADDDIDDEENWECNNTLVIVNDPDRDGIYGTTENTIKKTVAVMYEMVVSSSPYVTDMMVQNVILPDLEKYMAEELVKGFIPSATNKTVESGESDSDSGGEDVDTPGQNTTVGGDDVVKGSSAAPVDKISDGKSSAVSL